MKTRTIYFNHQGVLSDKERTTKRDATEIELTENDNKIKDVNFLK